MELWRGTVEVGPRERRRLIVTDSDLEVSDPNGVMPPVMLNDEQVAQVLTYVRNSWGNSGDIVTVDEVRQVHAQVAAQ